MQGFRSPDICHPKGIHLTLIVESDLAFLPVLPFSLNSQSIPLEFSDTSPAEDYLWNREP